jgi:cytochrome c peroxidase
MNVRVVTACGLLGLFATHTALTVGIPDGAGLVEEKSDFEEFVLMPLPAPVQTPNLVRLSPIEQLGKDIFFDHTLSSPVGYACATCHIPQSGFTGPSSQVNIHAGPVPGVIPGRAGRRKPQSISYATFSPAGPFLAGAVEGGTYLGGLFWDGRTPDLAAQAKMPFLDPNEMDNIPVGAYPPHAGGYSPLVAEKLRNRPYTALFKGVFGLQVFETMTDEEIYNLMTAAIATYEASAEVNPFSSKFDASTNGTPAMTHYTLSASEENGRQLFFGNAQCFQCHSSASLDAVSQATEGKETFTMYCYANIGVPKNPGNPYYDQTHCVTDPKGCNPLGAEFIDYGLGANPNPAPDGTLFMTATPGDMAQFRGLFKAPSLRNVNLRPYPSFVKSYMHNGVFKSLEEVVHFYNKRNIATNSAGLEAPFNWRVGPPSGFTAIFPPPEVMDNVQNVAGNSPAEAAQVPPDSDGGISLAVNGQVGNLQLTATEEADLVSFLKTLTDGYIRPRPLPTNGLSVSLIAVERQAWSGYFVAQIVGHIGQFYVIQTSTNLTDWAPVSTNVLTDPSDNVTNGLMPGATSQFWRVISMP